MFFLQKQDKILGLDYPIGLTSTIAGPCVVNVAPATGKLAGNAAYVNVAFQPTVGALIPDADEIPNVGKIAPLLQALKV